MANSELDAFLKREPVPEPDPAPAAQPEPEPEPKGEQQPEVSAETEGGAPPAPGDANRQVPLAALEGERRQRQDWKEKAVRFETEAAELRKQLEHFRTPQPQQQQQPQVPQVQSPVYINPVEDPVAFHRHTQLALLNTHLNQSELMMRKEIGREKLNEYVAEFQKAAETDPGLFQRLYSQQHPYEWLAEEVESLRLRHEIGPDPKAYREKLEQEIEAKILARNGNGADHQPQPQQRAPIGGQPSLATTRSAAPRGAPTFTGPQSLDDILAKRFQK